VTFRVPRVAALAPAAGLVVLSLLLPACKGSSAPTEPPPTTLPDTVSFAAHVKPLFQRHGCPACHGAEGGLSVATVASLLAGGTHGPAVIPGDAENSILIQKVGTAPPFGSRMPVGGVALSSADVDLLRRWINQGARNN
jgi:hypothetical protein